MANVDQPAQLHRKLYEKYCVRHKERHGVNALKSKVRLMTEAEFYSEILESTHDDAVKDHARSRQLKHNAKRAGHASGEARNHSKRDEEIVKYANARLASGAILRHEITTVVQKIFPKKGGYPKSWQAYRTILKKYDVV